VKLSRRRDRPLEHGLAGHAGLPHWLARRNKAILGTLFVVEELFGLGLWLIFRR
jgi:hypothetical protein